MRKIIFIISAILILGLSFYFYYYKRSFISNSSNTKYITIWKILGGESYIIPGKYTSIFKPEKNYIVTNSSAYLYIIWNPENQYYETSLYIGSSNIDKSSLDSTIEIIDSHDDFFYKYRGEFYDPSNSIVFDKDSIEYKKNKFELDYVDIGCLSTLFRIFPCTDN